MEALEEEVPSSAVRAPALTLETLSVDGARARMVLRAEERFDEIDEGTIPEVNVESLTGSRLWLVGIEEDDAVARIDERDERETRVGA